VQVESGGGGGKGEGVEALLKIPNRCDAGTIKVKRSPGAEDEDKEMVEIDTRKLTTSVVEELGMWRGFPNVAAALPAPRFVRSDEYGVMKKAGEEAGRRVVVAGNRTKGPQEAPPAIPSPLFLPKIDAWLRHAFFATPRYVCLSFFFFSFFFFSFFFFSFSFSFSFSVCLSTHMQLLLLSFDPSFLLCNPSTALTRPRWPSCGSRRTRVRRCCRSGSVRSGPSRPP
jgi:hypothetical protein